ncbi:glycosyltransferase family 4 protein [Pseudonocardiaceae bacterium YIM PH 21723]|nr:glycosyltransferase family 4 protein [Pseudonocardiaceae bacterium YIM PH 21723]
MRIGIVAKGNVFGYGGVERSVVRIAQGLQATGRYQVDVIELRPDLRADLASGGMFDFEPRVLPGGVSLFQIRAWCTSPTASERDFAVFQALVELGRRRGYELLNGFYASTAGFYTAYAARELGIPSVISLRGNDIHRDVFDGRRLAHLQFALTSATAITSVSAEGLRRAEILADCAGKGRVILNGIDPSTYAEGVVNVATGSPLIGSMAKFRGKKGLPTLIQAFAQLELPAARLLLIGDVVPEERDEALELITRCGVEDQVTITGFVPREDALRYLRALDLFVLSSIHEGCPNVLLEAMAAGVPAVATAVGAVPEMIVNDEAVVVPPGDATALAKGITELLSADRQAYADRALTAIRTRFAPDRELADFDEVYTWCLTR